MDETLAKAGSEWRTVNRPGAELSELLPGVVNYHREDARIRGKRRRNARRIWLLVGATSCVIMLGVAVGMLTLRANRPEAATSSCVSPFITLDPTSKAPLDPGRGESTRVAAGQSILVYGHWYFAQCQDTRLKGEGDDEALDPSSSALPSKEVEFVLVTNDGQTYSLGRAHPDNQGSLTLRVSIPSNASRGRAEIRDMAGHRTLLRIVG